MLEITDMGYSYGRGDAAHQVMDGISLRVARGELAAIAGPSGCGKSTLLRCIAGLLHPSQGTIVVNGTVVREVPAGLAVVFQDYSRSLYPWLTVRDNVALPLHKTQPRRAVRREIAQRALAAVGLADAAHRYPWQLSGGMQQRCAIARAIACDPVLLLMDEPFGSLDAQTREDLEDLILGLRRDREITILLVTHDIDEAVYTSDRVVILSGPPGRVRADLPVALPEPRDQIATRQLPAFVQLRAEASRLIRGQSAAAARQVPY
ncbi:MAG TPA: ABC transporter ATP-binding protein [Streptosporangiaceae bacterium]|nr:ABC transporter ATP-binding protein [Streptosporangiaceae bacterium]